MELSHFPRFATVDLPATRSCIEATKTVESLQAMRLAAAIASEVSKGTTSFYYPYLKLLPSLQEFHSFLPVLMEESVQKDFAPLPIMAMVQAMQATFDLHRKCFENWKVADRSPVEQLSWDEMLVAFIWLSTRSFGLDSGRTLALVPAVDIVNTGLNAQLNAQWIPTADAFTLHADRRIAAGTEIYQGYCNNCNNTMMMYGWGVYLETNPNPSQRGDQLCLGERGEHLQRVAEAALQTEEAAAKDWLSPRCKAEVLETPQGALRCSLARLSWETCAVDWAAKSTRVHSSVTSFSQAHPIIAKHAPFDVAMELPAGSLRGPK